jgi:hypothetical protein
MFINNSVCCLGADIEAVEDEEVSCMDVPLHETLMEAPAPCQGHVYRRYPIQGACLRNRRMVLPAASNPLDFQGICRVLQSANGPEASMEHFLHDAMHSPK